MQMVKGLNRKAEMQYRYNALVYKVMQGAQFRERQCWISSIPSHPVSFPFITLFN